MPQKKSHEKFISEIQEINPKIEILSKYINARTKVKCLCVLDNYQWESTPDNLLHGCGCPKCAGRTRNTETFKDELVIKNPLIQILGEYKTNDSKIKCMCKKHGTIFYSTPSHLLEGKGCTKCKSEKISSKLKISNEEFLNRIHLLNENIKICSDYINSHTDVLIECQLCHKQWTSNPNNIFSKGILCTCQQDSVSKGEAKIAQVLDKYDITYYSQKSFKGLVGVKNGLLSYDFYLPTKNMLIEFQGEQHYKPFDLFGGEEKYKVQKEHDLRKKNYAKSHNITLVEIMYKDYVKIESIIVSALNLHSRKIS